MFFDIDPIQIGNYTPYEVMLLAKQKRERETRLFEDNITLAWHTEAFARQKKLPSLSKVLKDKETVFYCCHCTGEDAYNKIKKNLKDKIKLIKVGDCINT